MAKAKDFSKVNTDNIYSSTIAEATQEPQEKPKKRKTRKTYDAQDTAEFMQDMKTSGRKGIKLPRMNLALSPESYDYVKRMSRAAGMSYGEFINKILQDHKQAHIAVYENIMDVRKSL